MIGTDDLARAIAGLVRDIDAMSLSVGHAVDEIRRLRETNTDLLWSLRCLVRYLRDVERWPTKADHMAQLGHAEEAIAKAEGRS